MIEQQYREMAKRSAAIADVLSDASAANLLREEAKFFEALADALAISRSSASRH